MVCAGDGDARSDDPDRIPLPVGACRDGADGRDDRPRSPVRGVDRVGIA